jgi:transmembrane sensor
MSGNENLDRLLQAAAWLTRSAESPEEHAEGLRAWLVQDPRNVDAWRSVQTPWQLIGEHAASTDLIRVRRWALTHAHDAGWNSRFKRLARPRSLAVAAVALVVAMISMAVWQTHRFDDYRTNAGERRVVRLDDGSEISLDSQTEVKVRYSARSRKVILVEGQARFDVAHDAARPFSVTANGHEVVATGTAFNVDLLGADLFVTLIEGHVVVVPEALQIPASDSPSPRYGNQRSSGAGSTPEPDTSSSITLEAGEQLVISPSAAPKVTHVNTDRATAWESGKLVFENEPLASIVLRVSRYGAHGIVIGDEQTSKLRISGVFHEGDVAGFVSTLVSYLPVSAQQDRDGSIRLTARNPPGAP